MRGPTARPRCAGGGRPHWATCWHPPGEQRQGGYFHQDNTHPWVLCPILLVNGFRKVDNFLTTVCRNIKASGDEVQIVCRNLLLFHFDGGRNSRQPKTRSLKVNFGKLDSTLSHLFSVLGGIVQYTLGFAWGKLKVARVCGNNLGGKVLNPVWFICYHHYWLWFVFAPLIEIERRSQVGMIPSWSFYWLCI